MTDKVYSLNEIQNSLVPILRKYGVSQAWVFGSKQALTVMLIFS